MILLLYTKFKYFPIAVILIQDYHKHVVLTNIGNCAGLACPAITNSKSSPLKGLFNQNTKKKVLIQFKVNVTNFRCQCVYQFSNLM